MQPDDPPHGTWRGYSYYKCREQCCRDAAARYERGRQWDILRGERRRVPLLGAQRRVQALQAMGWPLPTLAARMGRSRAWLNNVAFLNQSGYIFRSTFHLIDGLYQELADTPGPSRRTAILAAAKGYPRPAAWNNIDDPDETPDAGYNSAHTGRGSDPESRLADLEHAVRFAFTLEGAADWLGLSTAAVEKWCRNHGREDLLERMRGAA